CVARVTLVVLMMAISIVTSLLAVPSVHAQAATRPVPRVDTTAHRLPVDPTRIQAATSTYRVELIRDSVTSPLGDQRFVIALLDYAGTPALMLARDGGQGVTPATDSL